MVENNDRPGVIGDLGHFLAKNGVNIDSFELSRNRKGGKAMALIKVDSDTGTIDTDAMEKIPNVNSVKTVTL